MSDQVLHLEWLVLVSPNDLIKRSPLSFDKVFVHNICGILSLFHPVGWDEVGADEVKANADLTGFNQ